MTAEEIIQLIRDRARNNFKWSLDFSPGSDIRKLYDYYHRALSSMADEIENKLKEEQNMDKLEGDELKKDGGKVPMHLIPTPVEVKEEPKQETKKTQPTEAPKWVQRSLFD